MVQVGFRKPSTGVATGKKYVELLRVGANATAAKMLPGIFVIKDTNDRSVKESGAAGKVIGVLGYEDTPEAFRPTTRDTAYALGDTVAVIHGQGAYVRALQAASQTTVKGETMKVVADGYLEIGTPGTDDIVAVAEESVTTDEGVTAAIWVTLRI